MYNLFSMKELNDLEVSTATINNRIADFEVRLNPDAPPPFYDVLQWGADMCLMAAFEKLRAFYIKKLIEPFDFASEIKKRKASFDSEYLLFDFFHQKWVNADIMHTPHVEDAKLFTRKEAKEFLDNFQGPNSPYVHGRLSMMAFHIPPDDEQYGSYLPYFSLEDEAEKE